MLCLFAASLVVLVGIALLLRKRISWETRAPSAEVRVLLVLGVACSLLVWLKWQAADPRDPPWRLYMEAAFVGVNVMLFLVIVHVLLHHRGASTYHPAAAWLGPLLQWSFLVRLSMASTIGGTMWTAGQLAGVIHRPRPRRDRKRWQMEVQHRVPQWSLLAFVGGLSMVAALPVPIPPPPTMFASLLQAQ